MSSMHTKRLVFNILACKASLGDDHGGTHHILELDQFALGTTLVKQFHFTLCLLKIFHDSVIDPWTFTTTVS